MKFADNIRSWFEGVISVILSEDNRMVTILVAAIAVLILLALIIIGASGHRTQEQLREKEQQKIEKQKKIIEKKRRELEKAEKKLK